VDFHEFSLDRHKYPTFCLIAEKRASRCRDKWQRDNGADFGESRYFVANEFGAPIKEDVALPDASADLTPASRLIRVAF
jgi:hypothetical protein